MIKHFNTAFSASNSSAGTTSKSSGLGNIVILAIVVGAVYFGYKYIYSNKVSIMSNFTNSSKCTPSLALPSNNLLSKLNSLNFD